MRYASMTLLVGLFLKDENSVSEMPNIPNVASMGSSLKSV